MTPLYDFPGLQTRENAEPGFLMALAKVGESLGVDPNFLAAVMMVESGFQPSIPNGAGSGGVGLIQFMPRTARRLGTTTQALRRMTGIQQLPYVEAYYRPMKGSLTSAGQAYMATFNPDHLGDSDDTTIYRKGKDGKFYSQNSVLDRNGDGLILAGEVRSFAQRPYDSAVFKGRMAEPKGVAGSVSMAGPSLGIQIGFVMVSFGVGLILKDKL